ncbi:SDR family NAD(P)-dependent oxidoreductase [Actinophytocola sediminis]
MARLAVVSGGSSGIGKAVASALAGDGDRVVLLGRRAEVLTATAKEINAEVGAELVTWHQVDLTRPDEVRDVVAAVTSGGDEVDVLVNLAGGRQHGQPDSDDELAGVAAAWLGAYETNVLTTVLLTHALSPHLRRPGGRVIATSSNAAFLGRGSYGAAKSALHAWAYDLVPTLAKDGITVNVVAPGLVPDVESPVFQRRAEQATAVMRREVPLGRFGAPEEVAAAVVYLASAGAGYVTGQILQVNGGMVVGRG